MALRSHRFLSAIVALLFGAAITLTGCSSGSESDPSPGSNQRVVQTAQGKVKVPDKPKRVVVLNYALAGYLYDMDVPVAATTSEDFDHKAKFSKMWGDAPSEDGTEFLKWGMDGFDVEEILEYKPDLIIGGGIGLPNGLAVDAYDQLSEVAPTVIVDGKLDTWQKQYKFIASDVLGRDSAYKDAVTSYKKRVAEVKDAITVPAAPVSVLSITTDATPYVMMEDSGIAVELAQLGFKTAPVASEHKLKPYGGGGDMATLSTEQAGQILDDVPLLFITGFNADTTDVATLKKNDLWAGLDSFKNGHAYDLPYWTVRSDFDEAMALLDIIEDKFS